MQQTEDSGEGFSFAPHVAEEQQVYNHTLIAEPHFKESKFEIENIIDNAIYAIKLYRQNCFNEEEFELALEYLHPETNAPQKESLEKMRFAKGLCSLSLPFKVTGIDQENGGKNTNFLESEGCC